MRAVLIQLAGIASGLLAQRKQHFFTDASLPPSIRSMISVHLEQPWIPSFWTVAIRAVRKDCDRYLDFPIGFAEDGTSWFFPTRAWWLSHAQTSHPPAGLGFDIEGHAKFLTSAGGSSHAFDYATVTREGKLDVVTRAGFVEEGRWWSRAFPLPPSEDAT